MDYSKQGAFHFFRFAFGEVKPDQAEVLDFVRSSDLDPEHPAVLFAERSLHTIHPQGIFGGYILTDIDPVVVREGKVRTGKGTLSIGTQVGAYIKEATRLALFVCTAGDYFTGKVQELNRSGDIVEAYMLDAIGSLTVEKAMDRIQQHLANTLRREGLSISNRYSPGYCNWPLSDQTELFRQIGNNPTGIFLSDSCLMTPRKSVSGLIGIGQSIKKREYGCNICTNTTCIYRKIIHDK